MDASDDLIAFKRCCDFEYPPSFQEALGELVAMVQTEEFAVAFPDSRVLLTASEIASARGRSDDDLFPFLLSGGRDVHAFDRRSQGPEHAVVVWAVHTIVARWDGDADFLAWLRARGRRARPA